MENMKLWYMIFLKKKKDELGFANDEVARVVAEYKEEYRVKNENGEYVARIVGRILHNAKNRDDYPAVGDWVVVEQVDEKQMVIKAILPRRTVTKRSSGDRTRRGGKGAQQIIAVNVDVAFVVGAVGRDFNLNRLERYVVLAKESRVKPVIVLNKVDLVQNDEWQEMKKKIEMRFPEVEVVATSTIDSLGMAELKEKIESGLTYCFLGSSGVGKSTLINGLLGENLIKSNEVSLYSEKGKHTTTRRDMYFLDNGGMVIDNPGMREVGLISTDGNKNELNDGLLEAFGACQYRDCTHMHEPGCKILEAVARGELDEDKYQNYQRMRKEVEFDDSDERSRRKKDRQFGKMKKRYQEMNRNYL